MLNKIVTNFSYLLVITIIGIGVVGCSNKVRTPYVSTSSQQALTGAGFGGVIGSVGTLGLGPGALIGGAVGTIIGHEVQKKESIYLQKIDHIRGAGIDIYQEGDQIKFALLSSASFYDGSNNIKPAGRRPIYLVADLIKDLPVDTIEVVGFTSDRTMPKRNTTLSHARAITVMKELQKYKMGASIITARGEGVLLPYHAGKNVNSNDRVEIVLNPILHLNVG